EILGNHPLTYKRTPMRDLIFLRGLELQQQVARLLAGGKARSVSGARKQIEAASAEPGPQSEPKPRPGPADTHQTAELHGLPADAPQAEHVIEMCDNMNPADLWGVDIWGPRVEVEYLTLRGLHILAHVVLDRYWERDSLRELDPLSAGEWDEDAFRHQTFADL